MTRSCRIFDFWSHDIINDRTLKIISSLTKSLSTLKVWRDELRKFQ